MSKIAPWYRKEMDEKKWSPPDPVITILMCAVLVSQSHNIAILDNAAAKSNCFCLGTKSLSRQYVLH